MKRCPKCEKLHEKPGKFCSRICANSRTFNEGTLKLKSIAAKANPGGAVANRDKAYVPPKGHRFGANVGKESVQRVCETCSVTFTVPYHQRLRTYCDEHKFKGQGGLRPKSTIKHRSTHKGFMMDSGAELAFAQLLDKHNIKWVKNTTVSFDFVDGEGRNRKYYPDFYLPDYDHWVEIKGNRYVRPDDHLRLQAVGDNIELIMSHELRLPKL